MNVLILGSGGRESAFLHEIRKSPLKPKIFSEKPNALMAKYTTALDHIHIEQIPDLVSKHQLKLVIIGPEQPLVDGFTDAFRRAGCLVFGPEAIAAQLEGSKIFAKEFMQEFQIPTAHAVVVKSNEDILNHIEQFTPPYVLKADGLCAGKGVFICKDKQELLDAGKKLFVDKIFGSNGEQALLEQFEPGLEVSYFFLTNGHEATPLPLFRDHKRLSDNDEGPNTGGMGVIGPIENNELANELHEKILIPTVFGLQQRGYDYKGIVFVGVMLTENGPKVLEYNVRFGDPETQCILPCLDQSSGDDWLTVFHKIAQGEMPLMEWKKDPVACVVGAAEAYPDKAVTGTLIEGDPFINGTDHYVLHAGTALKDGKVFTSGGRVMNYIGIGKSYQQALDKAYAMIPKCSFKGMQYRRDIGKSLL